ncbi:MAG: peptidyl-tRNA hydrolase, family [Frankiales bacterium]|nr:peptidyl-tRNA hydrolase, family [Frankiales bacterium]
MSLLHPRRQRSRSREDPAADTDAQTHAAADADSDGSPWLVVGLGNPGPTYANNRHNVGAMVLDLLAERMGARLKSHKGRADVAEGRLDGHRVVLARPRSYMNESGGPVAGLSSFFRISPQRLVVIHDELDIPFGTVRLKYGGGDGGHNGLRSVRASLGTGDYVRVRVGVGRPPGRVDPAEFVLRDFSPPERKEVPEILGRAADAVQTLIDDGLAATQNRYHADG